MSSTNKVCIWKNDIAYFCLLKKFLHWCCVYCKVIAGSLQVRFIDFLIMNCTDQA